MNELKRSDIAAFVKPVIAPRRWTTGNSRPAAQILGPPAANSGNNMAVEIVDYNGYRLEVVPVGKGWRVSIYPPGSSLTLRESPSTLEKVLIRHFSAPISQCIGVRIAGRCLCHDLRRGIACVQSRRG